MRVSLEVPQWGASNEYHNVCFRQEIRKILTNLLQKVPYLELCYCPANFQQTTYWNFDLIFPREQDSHFMQIVSIADNLHELSNPVTGENKKNITNLSSAELN